ncbi:MAG: primase protein [Candidatus Moranbacteria bacterium GW2011_GWC2_37_8]|nr:MAG: primase protein [Candidatus Moranbacteria bacterium GW2011_GWC2_37_8]KKQ63219.1 MAG: primase protein [Parcubacteria group bacterium GW2011_GWC1_38_22]KKQ79949.1 MAG: primase protein [Candidatus Moranbacteria bacterium GW2011_GWD2_38_7]
MVNEEKQIYHCFGCAKGGDVFSFVQEIESMEFREVLKILAEKAGVQLEEFKGGQQAGDNKKRILDALELATKFYETQLVKGPGKEKIMDYLHGRAINDENIQKFRLGYAPAGWDNMLKFLSQRGYSLDEIEKTGLLVKKENGAGYYDRFRDRIMFPVMDIMGKVVGYSARVAPGQDESQAKYINTPESLVYHKSKVLYGLSLAKNEIKQKNYVLLVEGNLDVIASSQAGLGNVVAVSGTALTPDQVIMLKRYSENIAMLFDMDSAGQLAAQKSADLCLQKGVNVKIVTLADGKDAADVAQKNPELLLDAVRKSTPAMEYFFEQALKKHDRNSAEGKRNIAKDVLAHVVHIESQIEKSHWIKKIAHEVDVEEKVVNDVLKTVDSNSGKLTEENLPMAEKSSNFQKRSDILRDSMLGAIMRSAKVWEEIFDKENESEWVGREALISSVLRKGKEANFSFDQMLANIGDNATIERLRKIYFNTEFGFNDGISEYDENDVRQMAQGYIGQYIKELQKERLHSIIKEIEKAERSGDKEVLKKLMGQLTELSQAIK